MNSIVLISRKLAYFLRHSGITDDSGFVSVDVAIDFCGIDQETLLRVVESDSKNRFELKGELIRARYGHSKNVNPGLQIVAPPAVLYHGTTDNLIAQIKGEGLVPRSRAFVHLSHDPQLAIEAASRHKGGNPILLEVQSQAMQNDGFVFFQATNGAIWNVESVPPQYILISK